MQKDPQACAWHGRELGRNLALRYVSASAVGLLDLLRDHAPLAFAYRYLPRDDRVVRLVAGCGYFRLRDWLRRFDAALHVCKRRPISFFVARLAAPRP
jgi:hypothetical protein